MFILVARFNKTIMKLQNICTDIPYLAYDMTIIDESGANEKEDCNSQKAA